jgi:hypothetical protein
MDATVSGALATLLPSFAGESIGLLVDYIPVAGSLLVTVALLFFGIQVFREEAGI